MLFLLLIAVVVVKGQGEPKCCVPDDEWEAQVQIMGETTSDCKVSKTEGYTFTSISAKKTMKNHLTIETTDHKLTILRVLEDYQKNVTYTIDVISGNCTKFPLRRPFENFCVPGDSKLIDSTYIGTEAQNLATDIYVYNRFWFKLYFSVTPLKNRKFCAQISETAIFPNGMITGDFMAYHEGIRDGSVFIVPPQCLNLTAPYSDLVLHPTRRFRRFFFL